MYYDAVVRGSVAVVSVQISERGKVKRGVQ
jgi:hypothetical protein